MKSKLYWVLLSAIIIAIGLMAANCASIIHGTKQDVSVTSSPDQAKVEIETKDGVSVDSGTTPTTFNLKRKHSYNVTISLEGYQPQTLMIDNTFDATMLGNFCCGGIIGIIIDATNGAMYKLEPEMIHVELVQASVEGGNAETYAVFRTTNSDGELQTVVVPMIKE